MKANGDKSMLVTRKQVEDAYAWVLLDPRPMVRAGLLEPQFPVMKSCIPRHRISREVSLIWQLLVRCHNVTRREQYPIGIRKETNTVPTGRSDVVD